MNSIMIYSDDVFLVSYPRSGNTWMRYLLANISQPNDIWHLDNINQVVPDSYEVNVIEYTHPRIIKSHEPHTNRYPKVVYMYRDGRDVAVSYYDLSKKAFGYTGSFEDFLKAMLSGDAVVVYGSWQSHVSGWTAAAEKETVLPVKYEDLCADTFGIMSNVCSFLGKTVGSEVIEQAITKSAFRIQQDDVRKYSPFYTNGFLGGVKGGPGKWREVFTEEMNELFWYYAGDLMTRLGYSKT